MRFASLWRSSTVYSNAETIKNQIDSAKNPFWLLNISILCGRIRRTGFNTRKGVLLYMKLGIDDEVTCFKLQYFSINADIA